MAKDAGKKERREIIYQTAKNEKFKNNTVTSYSTADFS